LGLTLVPLNLSEQWHAWGDQERVDALSATIGRNRSDRSITQELRWWLDGLNKAVVASTEVTKALVSRVSENSRELEEAETKISILFEWLSNRPKEVTLAAPTTEADAIKIELDKLQARQRTVTELGQDAKAHLEHLAQVEAFIAQSWSKKHPDDCPSCGVNHASEGGIRKVVFSLKEKGSVGHIVE
jgi:hypothetical protein